MTIAIENRIWHGTGSEADAFTRLALEKGPMLASNMLQRGGRPSEPPIDSKKTALRGVTRIVLLYGVVAALWILFSDYLVGSVFGDPRQITNVSILKGWLFVLITTGLLFALLRRFAFQLLDREAAVLALTGHVDRERDLAESRIREMADRIALATGAAGVGIWDHDLKAGRLVWNDQMHELYGLEPRDWVGSLEAWIARVHPDDSERVERLGRAAVGDERDFTTEFRIVRPDGSVRVLKAHAIVQRDLSGHPSRVLGTNWDVTDYRNTLDALKEAKEQAEAASSAKSRFLATMSHELRTPLNAVIGFSEVLLANETDPDRRENLELIGQAGRTLLRLIHGILDLSKIEAGKIDLQMSDFDLKDELRGIATLFRSEAEQKGLTLSIVVAPAVPRRLSGHPGLLRQVLSNLIANALKFTQQGGIELVVEGSPVEPGRAGVRLGFHVSDTGTGIKPENLDRIFEPFEQEDNSPTRRFGGSGLGLAISTRLVALMGGTISVDSTPGVGSRFSFTVLCDSPSPASSEPASNASAVQAPPVVGRSVLVVEDDLFSRTLLSRVLEGAGYRVTAAADGVQALALLKDGDFEIILMDVRMPGLDGTQVTQLIRAGHVPGCPPQIPIIAVTAHAMNGDRERFLAAGMSDYIGKPVNISQVKSCVADWLTETETPSDAPAASTAV